MRKGLGARGARPHEHHPRVAGRGQRYDSILETVGDTPCIRINRIAPDGVTVYVKAEAFNPAGSVKDRLALNIIEAARDLGASYWQAISKIILPLIKPGIAAGGLIAFTLSVDDFLITYFTAGVGASTLPIRIYSMVKRGVTPDINALSALVLAATLFTLYLGLKFLHKPEKQG